MEKKNKSMKKNKIYAILFLIVVLIGMGLFFLDLKWVDINGKKFLTEVVSTNEDRSIGLGGREKLCRSCAMLFIFEKKAKHLFWMKGMKFDLDIIWIDDDEIVSIEKNVSHKSLDVLNPKVNANKVLEINAGISNEFDFKIGDRISFFEI